MDEFQQRVQDGIDKFIENLKQRQYGMANEIQELCEVYVKEYLPKLMKKMPPRDLPSLVNNIRLMIGQTTGNVAGEWTVFMYSGVEMPKTGGNPE